ncbi:hypothetical protein Kpol_1061p36 [Vanderwaltozyma polyspora DSM 70294]|uniref:CDC20/Fizzy WD40 domain-containing protein n=1 Tax=Vanderwaltozyma polyspora (strain ATCC 22028 / DSM 70294 / BCRC 21397 / CBS 2163 / NBRC 10782 / NRRL Y-8283 / UCD 57-17) TaxID=436907 RepID=A7TJG1_VANPO|nr:uncharacterized protein Kpol_1061p36 [Vanderwaltozyma polyspora DSM 70294]EDO17611.1 hypothetical protein Kpol_1061p36 [Vanderwaltozyma polyspora DSM 70294]
MSSSNPFMNNTPNTSPLKNYDGSNKRIGKRPLLNASNSSSQLTSPFRRQRNSGSVIYNDRFIPTRTEIDLNTIVSLSNTVKIIPDDPSNSEDQVEIQKKRLAHETFDAVLKNELFGEKLSRDITGTESSIDKIKNTKPTLSHSRYKKENSSSDEIETDVDEDQDGNLDLNGNPIDLPHVPNTPPDSLHRSDSLPTGSPVTPRRLFAKQIDEHYKPTSNSVRGASLLTYRERTSTRPSTTSILQSQFYSSSPVRPDSRQLLLSPAKKFRQIAKVPYRVLDAPSLADDFYYDLIDWSSTDMLAVALGKSIFLTDNSNGDVIHLCDTKDEYTSLSWVGAGSHLAVGQGNGLMEIYDVVKKKCIRTLSGHTDRVSCLSWNNNILSSGSRDRRILHRDVRIADPFFAQIETHTQEVCGLKWNVEENKLASGGNDNIVCVYDGTSVTPTLTFREHTAAVKAIGWSPHKRGILATGGGTADRRLKIWNVNTAMKLNDADTGSQVCNLIWSKNTDEIVTSHGYSKYNLTLWNYPTLEPIAILKGHSFRVLHLTLSADGTTVVSGAGDETLRYWKLFEKPKPKAQPESLIFGAFNQIR